MELKYTSRSGTDYPAAWIKLLKLIIQPRQSYRLNIETGEFEHLSSDKTSIVASFVVYKDKVACESGFEPVETLLLANPVFNSPHAPAAKPKTEDLIFEVDGCLDREGAELAAFERLQTILVA